MPAIAINPDKMPYYAMPKQVKVYDVNEKKLIGTFQSMRDAGNFLGLSYSQIQNIVKRKARNTSNKLGLTITCR